MSDFILIRSQDRLLPPDNQEIFLSPPNPVARLCGMLRDEFRDRLRAAVERAASRKDVYGDGVSEGGLSKILSGEVENPRIFTVKSIADRLGVTVGELLGETGFELTAADRAELARIAQWIAKKLGEQGSKPGLPGHHSSGTNWSRKDGNGKFCHSIRRATPDRRGCDPI
jgi:transcriptional regulator with XRE-family HTH domain